MSINDPIATQRSIDRICDEFEDDWSPDQLAKFGGQLDGLDEHEAHELISDLIDVDLEMRAKLGFSVSAHYYSNLFPNKNRRLFEDKIEKFSPHLFDTESPEITDTRVDTGEDSQTIGPYQLVRKIGQGGMGSVWLAKQFKPIQRTVAIKVIRPGFGSEQIISRFEMERQTLAMMDHPNIARIVDAGTTSRGSPYFAMELVEGLPLTTYCRDHHVSLEGRLALFRNVCQAVQHAHQKGIIHRDLKPSNILVSDTKGTLEPKIIDFGLAKVFEDEQQPAQYRDLSVAGQILGSFQYMSPEQAELENLNVDTRSDIYSLGIILYELLTDKTPISRFELEELSVLQLLDVVRTREATRPSRNLSDHTPFHLNRRNYQSTLANDLDWIVMKAIEKDPLRRYESAGALCDDLIRFQNNEAVIARPPSTSYVCTKFIRKHWFGVTAASIVAVALVAGLVGTTLSSLRAVNAEKKALKRLAHLESGTDVLAGIFSDLDLTLQIKSEQPVESALAQKLIAAIDNLNEMEVEDSLVIARLQQQLGNSLVSLGYPKEAIPVLQDSFLAWENQLGWHNSKTLDSAVSLGLALDNAGESQKARKILDQAIGHLKSTAGVNDRSTLRAHRILGNCLVNLGQIPEAESLFRSTLATLKEHYGEDDRDYIDCLFSLCRCLSPVATVQIREQILDWYQDNLGLSHIKTLQVQGDLAEIHSDMGNFKVADQLYRDVVAKCEAELGQRHPLTLQLIAQMATNVNSSGAVGDAIPLLEHSMYLTIQKYGKKHELSLQAMNRLASAYRGNRDAQKAIQLFQETLQIRRSENGELHYMTLMCLNNLAYGHYSAADYEEAQTVFREAIESTKLADGETARTVYPPLNGMGLALMRQGNHAASIPYFKEALDICVQSFGKENISTQKTLFNLCEAHLGTSNHQQAIRLLEENVTMVQANPKLTPQIYLLAQGKLGVAYLHSGNPGRGVQILESMLPELNNNRFSDFVWDELAAAYCDLQARDRLAELLQRRLTMARNELAAQDRLFGVLIDCGACWVAYGDGVEAERLLRECMELEPTLKNARWRIPIASYYLGKALQLQGRINEAEPLLIDSANQMVEVSSSISRHYKPVVDESIETVVQLFNDSGLIGSE